MTIRIVPKFVLLVIVAVAVAHPRAGLAVQAVFDPSGPSFYDLPFPHELRRDPDGTPSIAGFPFPSNSLVDQYRAAIEASVGFGIASAVFFKFDGAIDPATLPQTPDASRTPGASAFLIGIDPRSKRRGSRVPLWIDFRQPADSYRDANLLTLMPVPGHVLAQGTLYAAVVLDAVEDPTGAPVTAPPSIERLKAGTPAGAFELAARRLYEHLWGQLEDREGISRSQVVTATVFRTGRPADQLEAAVKLARKLKPAPSDFTYYSNQGAYSLFTTVVSMPQFQDGNPPFTTAGTGKFVFDDHGKPIVQREEPVRVVLAVPNEDVSRRMPKSGWPIATCMHGTGGDAFTFVADATAYRLATLGIASISFDQPLHGLRPGTSDDFYNVLNPFAFRDNTRQAAVEGSVVHDLIRRLQLEPTLFPSPPARTIKFDRKRRLFFGHSQGATVGPLVLALVKQLRGGVLSAGGGHLLLNILTVDQPLLGDLTAKQLVEALLGAPVDVFHPALHLIQMGGEVSDPLAYVDRFWLNRAGAPLSVLFTHGLLDTFVTTPLTASMVIAARYPLLAPTFPNRIFSSLPSYDYHEGFDLAGLPTLDPPVTGNVGDGAATGGLSLFEFGDHFPVFFDPAAIAQWTGFVDSLARESPPTIPARP